MPRRSATLAATAALGLALTGVFAAPASAETTPTVTVDSVKSEITALVCADIDTDVAGIHGDIDTLVSLGLTATDQSTLNGLLAQKVTDLDCDAVTDPPVTTTPPVETADPTPAPARRHHPRPVVQSETQIDALTDALACGSTNTDLQVIDRAIAARQAAHQDTAESSERLGAKLASLNCSSGALTSKAAAQTAKDCGCVTTETTTEAEPTTVERTVTVNPTADDGSVATTSGDQVTDVPEGSAQTGSL